MISTEKNEGTIDRIVRVIVGIVLIGAGIYLAAVADQKYMWGWLVAAVGLIPLVTGIIGFCPIYTILKIGTAGKKAEDKSPAK